MTQLITYSHRINPADQTKKLGGLTDKYFHVNTREVEAVFQDNGFIKEGISVARSAARDGFQKHLSIWTRDDLNLGEEKLQLLLTNSHDGRSAFKLDVGVFRFVCANGLVSGDIDTSIAIRHSKNSLDRIDDSIKYLFERLPQVAANVNRFKSIDLDNDQVKQFCKEAIELRVSKPVYNFYAPQAKRAADGGNDLWTILNILQEHTIRGGFKYFDTEAEAFKKTRKISAIDKTIKLNKSLWDIAEKIAA